MSRPITITDEMKQKIHEEFTGLLTDIRMQDGEISFSKTFEYEDDVSATLWLTLLAYRKTAALVDGFSGEVAWHGIATRGSEAENEFIIEDIIVYPQEVTGSTVSTDQEGYTKWLYEFDDETFNKIRMQGHSHADMGVTPSNVDRGHREKILDQLDGDMFYIFMVWNKRLMSHTLIYDMKNNILYEDGDITVKILGDDTLAAFMADAKEKTQKKEAGIEKLNVKRGRKLKPAVYKKPELMAGIQYGMYDLYGLGG